MTPAEYLALGLSAGFVLGMFTWKLVLWVIEFVEDVLQ